MKQVKFHRTELSLSVSGAKFCAFSENRGLSLQKLQERQVFNEKLGGIGSKINHFGEPVKKIVFPEPPKSIFLTGPPGGGGGDDFLTGFSHYHGHGKFPWHPSLRLGCFVAISGE